jgi:hypothetical protein
MPHPKHLHHRASGGRVDEKDPPARKNAIPESGSTASELEDRKRGGRAEHEKKKK